MTWSLAIAGSMLAPMTASVAAQSPVATPETGAPANATHEFSVVTVAEGLVNPWSLAFLPNGDVLVTERPGRLSIIRAGVLDPTPIDGVPEVFASGQGGLLDIVLHPEFTSNRLVYLSFTKRTGDGTGNTEAIVRGRLTEGALTDLEPIFEAKLKDVLGRLRDVREGPDGFIYIAIDGGRGTPTPVARLEPRR